MDIDDPRAEDACERAVVAARHGFGEVRCVRRPSLAPACRLEARRTGL
jgi:hypothetical protein